MSLGSKAALLALIFLVVPVILYDQFRAADQQKRQLLMNSVRDQGHIISVALAPILTSPGAPNLPAIAREISRFDSPITTVKLLFQPASTDGQGFFYVASSSPLTNAALDAERETLRQQGVLGRLHESCAGDVPIEMR
ncbi:MAG: two-component system, OmpR family, sensor histidine kinase ChvG, partial [Aliidongia sp.]|nr:two-component system, OmpR family, sensor histidine kinase ChvG [Aliidongia sp.]